ncbi:hypothetical protein [Paenibacillus kandeliae]|uniref:hypothetical protein n=1 Tax=Paenibacillus kandeliae TaxID=3231269 RepID=UPI003459F26C
MNKKNGGNVNQRQYDIIALHMMEWNPMKLREWCLPDEYNIEIEHIVNILPHVHSAQELGQQLFWMMQKYFGPYAKCSTAECEQIADEMYTDLQAVPETATPVASFHFYEDRLVLGTYRGGLYRRSRSSD